MTRYILNVNLSAVSLPGINCSDAVHVNVIHMQSFQRHKNVNIGNTSHYRQVLTNSARKQQRMDHNRKDYKILKDERILTKEITTAIHTICCRLKNGAITKTASNSLRNRKYVHKI